MGDQLYPTSAAMWSLKLHVGSTDILMPMPRMYGQHLETEIQAVPLSHKEAAVTVLADTVRTMESSEVQVGI